MDQNLIGTQRDKVKELTTRISISDLARLFDLLGIVAGVVVVVILHKIYGI